MDKVNQVLKLLGVQLGVVLIDRTKLIEQFEQIAMHVSPEE